MSTAHTHRPRDWREARRSRAWELHQQGWQQTKIAQALGVTPSAVSQWLARARLHGQAALASQSRPGRPAQLSAQQRRTLDGLLRQGAEAFGFAGAIWTRRRVARLISEQFAINYTPRHVGRILAQIDWSPQRPIVRATQRDEEAVGAWYAERWPRIKKKHEQKAESSSS
jgi:transposase